MDDRETRRGDEVAVRGDEAAPDSVSDPGSDATVRSDGADDVDDDERNSTGNDVDNGAGGGDGGGGEGRQVFAGEWYDDDVGCSSDDTDDEPDAIHAFSFREAAEHLEARGEIGLLSVALEDEEEEMEDASFNDSGNDARSFRRFVAALGQRRRGGGCSVRSIEIFHTDWESGPQEDLERLCRDVLPFHPTVERLVMGMPPPYGRILVSSIPAGSRMRVLEFEGAIDRETVQSIADMIRRDVPLTRLHVHPLVGPRLDGADCKLLCQAMSCNATLRKLFFTVGNAFEGAFDGAVASSSPLRTLWLYIDEVSDECVSSFARQLRTNTTLERLKLLVWSNEGTGRPSPFLGPMAEVLENYNVTLRSVKLAGWRPAFPSPGQAEEVRVLNRYIRRNRRIRRALEELEPLNYYISSASLWPRAFEMVTSLPTLLYRFLRRGNVEALCDVLLPPESSTKGKKRARAIAHDSKGGQNDDEG